MADDQFTSELEWMLHLRRESVRLAGVLRLARDYVKQIGSTQEERSIRVWASPEIAKLHDDLDQAVELLGGTKGRYLMSAKAVSSLPSKKALELHLSESNGTESVSVDTRPIKGRGRRHSESSQQSVRYTLRALEKEAREEQLRA